MGAKIKGLFSLSANTSIKILIGQMGLGGGDSVGGGGGGASFVISGSNTPILVAGAGGGGSYHATFEPGASSRIGGNGKVELSSLTSAGATHNASGGAGFNSSSVPGSQAGIASSFTSGGTGATGKVTTTVDLAAVAVEAAVSLPVGEAEDIAVVMPPR